MDVEESQEMLDVGVKKSGRDAPSSVGCVPWRLVWLHDVFFVCPGGWQIWNLSNLFTKPGGWLSLHDVFFGKQVHNTSFHSMTSETKQRSNGPM